MSLFHLTCHSICLFWVLHFTPYVSFSWYILLHTCLFSCYISFNISIPNDTFHSSFSCVLQFIQFVYSSRYILLNISIFHVKFHWIGLFLMLFWLSITNPYVKFHSICVVLVWHFTQYVSLKCYISLNMSIPHVTFHSVLLLYSTFHSIWLFLMLNFTQYVASSCYIYSILCDYSLCNIWLNMYIPIFYSCVYALRCISLNMSILYVTLRESKLSDLNN